jgi:hypothetical protein
VKKKAAKRIKALAKAGLILGFFGLVFAIALFGPASTQTLSGSIKVTDTDENNSSVFVYDGFCITLRGYSDIGGGTDVIVKDGAGKVIALTQLLRGTPVGLYSCRFDFEVKLPSSEFYSFSIGDRDEITYSKAELVDRSWRLDLTLGN